MRKEMSTTEVGGQGVNVNYMCVKNILIVLHLVIVLILIINVFISMLLYGPKLSTIIAFYDSCESLCSDTRNMDDMIYRDESSFVAIIIFFAVVLIHVIAMIGVLRENLVVCAVSLVVNVVIALFFINLIKTNLFLCQLFVIMFEIVFIVFLRTDVRHKSYGKQINNDLNANVTPIVPIVYCPHHNESMCWVIIILVICF